MSDEDTVMSDDTTMIANDQVTGHSAAYHDAKACTIKELLQGNVGLAATSLSNDNDEIFDGENKMELLDLPREVLGHICRQLLGKASITTYVWASASEDDEAEKRIFYESIEDLDTSILRVCRILHDEGARILYGENEWNIVCRNNTSAQTFTRNICSPKYIHLISKAAIHLLWATNSNHQGQDRLEQNFHLLFPSQMEVKKLRASLRKTNLRRFNLYLDEANSRAVPAFQNRDTYSKYFFNHTLSDLLVKSSVGEINVVLRLREHSGGINIIEIKTKDIDDGHVSLFELLERSALQLEIGWES